MIAVRCCGGIVWMRGNRGKRSACHACSSRGCQRSFRLLPSALVLMPSSTPTRLLVNTCIAVGVPGVCNVGHRYAQTTEANGIVPSRGGAVESAAFSSSMNNARLATAPGFSMPRAPRAVNETPKFVTPSPQHYGDVAPAMDKLSNARQAPSFTIGVKLKDEVERAEALGFGPSSVPAPGGNTLVPSFAREAMVESKGGMCRRWGRTSVLSLTPHPPAVQLCCLAG